jgi:hypothetical protein
VISHSTTSNEPRSEGRLVSPRHGALIISCLTLVAILMMTLAPRIPQSLAYHDFADQRGFLGITNFLNVASNVGFLWIGSLGVLFVWGNRGTLEGRFTNRSERWPYLIFFLGVTLTCFGSAYYHLSPGNDRLMWDRLPMSIAFMSLVSAVIAERISLKAGLVLLAPLLSVGAGSVVYWHLGEMNGAGDLRPYVLVQFYSMLAVVVCAVIFPSKHTHGRGLAVAVGWYTAAKLFESLDQQVFALGGIVSGHTVKHTAAATAAFCILQMLKRRSRLVGQAAERPLDEAMFTTSRLVTSLIVDAPKGSCSRLPLVSKPRVQDHEVLNVVKVDRSKEPRWQ